MTQKNFKIKRGDLVMVMVGVEKGRTGIVKKVLLESEKIIVEGVRQVTRFIRPSQQYPEGKYRKTLPIHISNVAVVDPSTDKPVKVGYRLNEQGVKERFCKKSGTILERNFK